MTLTGLRVYGGSLRHTRIGKMLASLQRQAPSNKFGSEEKSSAERPRHEEQS
jgi:hypothetical protein